MPLLAVIAEPFAVIGDEDDRGLIVELMRLQVLHEPADDFVGVGDLGVVRRELGEPRRSGVGRVGLVQDAGTETRAMCRPTRSHRSAIVFGVATHRAAPAPLVRSDAPSGISPSKNVKPWLMPVSFRSTNDETTAPVA